MSWGEIRAIRMQAARQQEHDLNMSIELEKRGLENRNIIYGYMSSGARQLSRLDLRPREARWGGGGQGNKVG